MSGLSFTLMVILENTLRSLSSYHHWCQKTDSCVCPVSNIAAIYVKLSGQNSRFILFKYILPLIIDRQIQFMKCNFDYLAMILQRLIMTLVYKYMWMSHNFSVFSMLSGVLIHMLPINMFISMSPKCTWSKPYFNNGAQNNG